MTAYQRDKLEFARRAGGQVVTNGVCFRSQPDPLGIVLRFDKLEFVELFVEWCAGGKWGTAKAPLCKGSWPGGPEGLCSKMF